MKIFSILIASFICWIGPALAQESINSGILRIQVDIDSVTLTIDNEIVSTDSYGNHLIKQGSFILTLIPGDHALIFSAKNYDSIDTTITIVLNESLPINIKFLADNTTAMVAPEMINVNMISQPDSVRFLIKNRPDTLTTPVSVSFLPGMLSFKAFQKGYESLSASYDLSAGENVSLEFLLKTGKPKLITIFDLDLELKPILRERNVGEAKIIRTRFNSFAEMFAIFPLSQGIIAKMILGSDNDSDADILIISGVVLTAGSLILGKILQKKRIKTVEKFNMMIQADNLLAKQFNIEINKTAKSQNAENLKQWKIKNDGKGIIRPNNE